MLKDESELIGTNRIEREGDDGPGNKRTRLQRRGVRELIWEDDTGSLESVTLPSACSKASDTATTDQLQAIRFR